MRPPQQHAHQRTHHPVRDQLAVGPEMGVTSTLAPASRASTTKQASGRLLT
jgi:hypothetical protein